MEKSLDTKLKKIRLGQYKPSDFIKTVYTGDKKSFKVVLDNCSVPVLILGGPKIDTDRAVLELVHYGMAAGAVGITTIGRNI